MPLAAGPEDAAKGIPDTILDMESGATKPSGLETGPGRLHLRGRAPVVAGTIINRQPEGIPIGGQFAPTSHASAVSLAAAPQQRDTRAWASPGSFWAFVLAGHTPPGGGRSTPSSVRRTLQTRQTGKLEE